KCVTSELLCRVSHEENLGGFASLSLLNRFRVRRALLRGSVNESTTAAKTTGSLVGKLPGTTHTLSIFSHYNNVKHPPPLSASNRRSSPPSSPIPSEMSAFEAPIDAFLLPQSQLCPNARNKYNEKNARPATAANSNNENKAEIEQDEDDEDEEEASAKRRGRPKGKANGTRVKDRVLWVAVDPKEEERRKIEEQKRQRVLLVADDSSLRATRALRRRQNESNNSHDDDAQTENTIKNNNNSLDQRQGDSSDGGDSDNDLIAVDHCGVDSISEEKSSANPAVTPQKRGRGRPKRIPTVEKIETAQVDVTPEKQSRKISLSPPLIDSTALPKRGPGRPPKIRPHHENQIQQQQQQQLRSSEPAATKVADAAVANATIMPMVTPDLTRRRHRKSRISMLNNRDHGDSSDSPILTSDDEVETVERGTSFSYSSSGVSKSQKFKSLLTVEGAIF
ncbi:hypothetical protein HK100_011730, partial [Physocladia obscura]